MEDILSRSLEHRWVSALAKSYPRATTGICIKDPLCLLAGGDILRAIIKLFELEDRSRTRRERETRSQANTRGKRISRRWYKCLRRRVSRFQTLVSRIRTRRGGSPEKTSWNRTTVLTVCFDLVINPIRNKL